MAAGSSGYVRLLLAVGIAMLMGATGCPFLDDGGGGGGTITFNSGYVFIRNDDQNVYVADVADLSDVGQLTTNGGNKHPSLSFDGTQAVFVHQDGTVSSIMTVATNQGGAPRTVYTAEASQKNFKNPVFSPDAATIVFAYEVGTTSFLAKINADDTSGNGFATLTPNTLSYASPSFFPSNHANAGWVLAVAGSTIGTYTQLDRIQVSTAQVLPVTNNLGLEAGSIVNRAVLSPDGLKVAFDGRLSSTAVRIFVQPSSGGATVRISDTGAGSATSDHSYPTWTATTDVGFVSNEGGANQVYVQPDSSTGTGNLTLPSADQPWFGPI